MTGRSVALIALLLGAPVAAQPSLNEVLLRPIGIERSAVLTELPLTIRSGKLHIEAEVDGRAGEFLFDTGSPTVLSRQFADTLDLEVIGQNTGIDSHGNRVTMEFAIVDRLVLGGVAFRRVPVLIHDFSKAGMGRCLVGNGLIGSEIFDGSVWRIDTQAKRLSIAASAENLPTQSADTVRAKLYDAGYPHAPILDYSVGNFADKAMFDTGNAANIAWFERATEHPDVRNAIASGSLSHGRGYEGESAGGLSEVGKLTRFDASRVSFESGGLTDAPSITRSNAPTLFGAGLLESYIVTLDYPGGQVTFERRSEPAPLRRVADYGIAMIEGRAIVARLFAGSPAARAGLELGDEVIEVNDRSMLYGDEASYCGAVNWLVDRFDPNEAAQIVVQRGDETLRLSIPAPG